MRRRRAPAVSDELTARIETALGEVDRCRERLAEAVTARQPREMRRAARAELRAAFDVADQELRRATAMAKAHSYLEWSRWRTRLTRLDTARQLALFAEVDDIGLLGLGTVRAVDTGMSGPAIGDLQHGASRPAGAPRRYGLDLDAVLAAPSRSRFVPRAEEPAGAPAAVPDAAEAALAAVSTAA